MMAETTQAGRHDRADSITATTHGGGRAVRLRLSVDTGSVRRGGATNRDRGTAATFRGW